MLLSFPFNVCQTNYSDPLCSLVLFTLPFTANFKCHIAYCAQFYILIKFTRPVRSKKRLMWGRPPSVPPFDCGLVSTTALFVGFTFKFGIIVVYKKLWSEREGGRECLENRCSESHTFLMRIHEFVSVLSTCFVQFC
jgi:hypothetical protein